ncbi:MAG: peroxiredoxin family protein, partial [Candidatus Poribacteria bacterium]
AEVKTLDSSGRLVICKGDLCLSLDINGADVVSIDGIVYASLATFARTLGFSWRMEDDALQVTSSAIDHIGLGVGDYPPNFTLPDLYTGELVSLRDYRGKKAIFFIWATW